MTVVVEASSRRSCSSGSPSCARPRHDRRAARSGGRPRRPEGATRQRSRLPAVRPRHRAQRHRGRVLRGAHDAAGRPGDARPAHRRAVVPVGVYFTRRSTGTTPSSARRCRPCGAASCATTSRGHPGRSPTSSSSSSAGPPSSGTCSSRTGPATPATEKSPARSAHRQSPGASMGFCRARARDVRCGKRYWRPKRVEVTDGSRALVLPSEVAVLPTLGAAGTGFDRWRSLRTVAAMALMPQTAAATAPQPPPEPAPTTAAPAPTSAR